MVIALYHNYNTQALEKPTELARNKQTNKQTNKFYKSFEIYHREFSILKLFYYNLFKINSTSSLSESYFPRYF